jgi:ribosome-binding factor A
VTDRMRRVNEQLRQVVSEAVGELADPRLGFVTVTGVETTTDLEHATVYVQVLGSQARRDKSLDALAHARGALQERVGRQVRLRRVPRLSFAYDESLDRGLRIGEILAKDPPSDEPIPEGSDVQGEP